MINYQSDYECEVKFTQHYTRLIYRLRISMKIHVCIKQGLFQSWCNLTLELIFKSENQRNWPNQCNFLIVTLSSRLLFVIFSLLQHKFLGGNKWVSTELCVTLCEFHFSNCPKYLDAFIPYFADVYLYANVTFCAVPMP